MTHKPWDSRLARGLVYPLRHTGITPNHVTTLSLLFGLSAGVLYASGESRLADGAALLFILSALFDHADGELARLTGRTSRFGRYYDLVVGWIVYVALFMGIGWGLRDGALGGWSIVLGLVAGISISVIFALLFEAEERSGKAAVQQPEVAGFQIEDVMYLVGPITWFGGLQPFLIAAGIGAPLFAAWTAWTHRKR